MQNTQNVIKKHQKMNKHADWLIVDTILLHKRKLAIKGLEVEERANLRQLQNNSFVQHACKQEKKNRNTFKTI